MKENHAFTIEGAVPEDAEELVAIYDYYVQNTAITFESVSYTHLTLPTIA